MTSVADLFDLGDTRFLDLGPGVFGTVSTVPDLHGRYGFTARGSGWFVCGTGTTVDAAEKEAAREARDRRATA